MLLPEDLMQEYNRRLAFHSCPVPILTQNTLHLFLSGGYFIRHVNRMRKFYKEKREIILQELNDTQKITLTGINAGLNVVLLYHGKQKEEDLCHIAPKKVF